MVKIELPRPRSTISGGPEDLRIMIPVERKWPLILFMSLLLGVWACAGVATVWEVIHDKRPDAESLYPLLVFISIAFAFTFYLWLWCIVGKEAVCSHGKALILRREILGLGKSREFDLSHVRDVRIAPAGYNPALVWSDPLSFYLGMSTLAFDYGAKTYRFGIGLDEAEAKLLVNAIRQQFLNIPENEQSASLAELPLRP